MNQLRVRSAGTTLTAALLFGAGLLAVAQQPGRRGGGPPDSYSAQILSDDAGLRQRLARSSTYQELRKGLHKVLVDGREYYIAEGDLPLDEDQLLIYSEERERARKDYEVRKMARTEPVVPPPLGRAGLLGVLENGKQVRWKPGLDLTYCVLKKQFTSPERYRRVVEDMAAATEGWEQVCGVSFQHRPPLDETDGVEPPPGAVFCVREFNFGDGTIAMSFFPNDPVERRKVLVDASYFAPDLPFERVGVLRHEIGHILGFRHEHIRIEAPPDCPREPSKDANELTAYDPLSVMHYLCGRAGSRELRFTQTDRLGAQLLYGPPLRAVKYAGDERR